VTSTSHPGQLPGLVAVQQVAAQALAEAQAADEAEAEIEAAL
jgi:hypothetical protein